MSDLPYNVVKFGYRVAVSIFFREIQTSGVHGVPLDDPCIFIVAPHANQFLDPGMVMITNPRHFAPLMAQSSFKQKLIGLFARMVHSIPVIRPQDLATIGTGSLYAKEGDPMVIIGQETAFTQHIRPRDILALSKTVRVEVTEVLSDTEIRLKAPLTQEALAALEHGEKYKVIPHVEQAGLFTKVHEHLAQRDSIVIFPEGGSHDRPEMLPLKAGFAIMALGAMAEREGLTVKIVPIGLNYFHPHRFRSRAVISYGNPITLEPELVEKYKQGGQAKRDAIATVIQLGFDGLKSVTVNASSYETLLTIAAARRLYKPATEHKLPLDQVVELNRRFLIGYKHFENDPRLLDLAQKVKAYNNMLKYFGLHDHQVERTRTTVFSATPILIVRLIKLCFLALLGFPSMLINAPILLLALTISQKKQREALAASSVKIAARDVVATWKVLVALVFAPILYGIYSVVLLCLLQFYTSLSMRTSVGLSVGLWIVQPVLHYACLLLIENGAEILRSLNPLIMAIGNPDAAAHLRQMREQLSNDVTRFVKENGPVALKDYDPHKFDLLEPRKSEQPPRWRGMFADITPSVLQHWLDDHALFNFGGDGSPDAW